MKSILFEINIPRVLATKGLALIYPKVFYSRLSALKYREIEEPELPGEDWLRLKSLSCGICGSDLNLILLKINPKVSLAALPRHLPKKGPKFLGHEVVAEVIEKGRNVKEFRIGDRATLRSGPTCATIGNNPCCKNCIEGNYSLCENKSEAVLPQNMGGGWSEYFVAHKAQLFKLHEDINDEQGTLLEPAACSLHAVLRHYPEKGEKVLVVGCGSIGLNVIQTARILSPECNVTALAKYPFQGEMAKNFGADQIVYYSNDHVYQEMAELTGSKLYRGMFGNTMLINGFDVIYDCVGTAKTIHDSLRWTRSRGTIVLVGTSLDIQKFDCTPLWNQEIRLMGSEGHGMESWNGKKISSFDFITRLVLDNRINLRDLITHRFKLSSYGKALETSINKKKFKTIKAIFIHK